MRFGLVAVCTLISIVSFAQAATAQQAECQRALQDAQSAVDRKGIHDPKVLSDLAGARSEMDRGRYQQCIAGADKVIREAGGSGRGSSGSSLENFMRDLGGGRSR
jgi:hypothetical protein